jgi:Contractile injection system tube protein
VATEGLERAYLRVFEPGKDSLDAPGPERTPIKFQFNPKEITFTKSAHWEHHKTKRAKSSGPPQYTGPEPGKLTLEMFFDTSDAPGSFVKDQVDALFRCCVPTSDTRGKAASSAPWVMFRWGELTGFYAFVRSVSAKYTLFSPGGMPLRAVCTVNLEEIAGEKAKQNPTSGGLLPKRVHVFDAGDGLAALAWSEYGDPALWRRLAEVNGIDDPQRIPSGTPIFLPAAVELIDGARRAAVEREVRRAAR